MCVVVVVLDGDDSVDVVFVGVVSSGVNVIVTIVAVVVVAFCAVLR